MLTFSAVERAAVRPALSWRSACVLRCSARRPRVDRPRAATPTFWTVSTQPDFLKGDVEDLVDRQRRSHVPRTDGLARRRDLRAVPVDGRGGRGRHAVGGQRQRGPGAEDREGRQGSRRSSTRTSSKFMRWRRRPTAGCTSRPRPTARSIRSPPTARRTPSSILTTSTSGRSRSIARATSSRPPATRASSTRSRQTARARASTRRTPATWSRSRSRRTATSIAGTESPGRVFRIDATGKAFVLLDSPFREIHAVRLADDGTHLRRRGQRPDGGEAGSLASTAGPDTARRPCRRSPPRSRRSPSSTPASPAPRRQSAGDARRARGAIYRIQPDGLWDTLWDSGDDAPYDLRGRARRQPARRHRHRGQDLPHQRRAGARDAARRARAPEQVTALLREPSGRVVGAASNPGKLFALSPPRRRGARTTPTCATRATVARWGVIRWRAVARTAARSRSSRAAATPRRPTRRGARGRSPTPTPKANRSRSPNARYLQWRAVLSADERRAARC